MGLVALETGHHEVASSARGAFCDSAMEVADNVGHGYCHFNVRAGVHDEFDPVAGPGQAGFEAVRLHPSQHGLQRERWRDLIFVPGSVVPRRPTWSVRPPVPYRPLAGSPLGIRPGSRPCNGSRPHTRYGSRPAVLTPLAPATRRRRATRNRPRRRPHARSGSRTCSPSRPGSRLGSRPGITTTRPCSCRPSGFERRNIVAQGLCQQRGEMAVVPFGPAGLEKPTAVWIRRVEQPRSPRHAPPVLHLFDNQARSHQNGQVLAYGIVVETEACGQIGNRQGFGRLLDHLENGVAGAIRQCFGLCLDLLVLIPGLVPVLPYRTRAGALTCLHKIYITAAWQK